MTTPKTIKEEIRDICTYHSDDGTSGYSLSEEQFKKLFDLFHHYSLEAVKEFRERSKIEKKKDEEWECLQGCKHKLTYEEYNQALSDKSAKEEEVIKKMKEEK